MFTWSLTYQQSVFMQYRRIDDFSAYFTYKMAAENGGHRYEAILRHCHAGYMLQSLERRRLPDHTEMTAKT